MVEIEIEGETREIDEDKIERLVKYEDAVIHDEKNVSSPTVLTAYETIETHLPSFLMTLYPDPLSGTVIDVDMNEQQTRVTLKYKYRGSVETEVLHTDSSKFANLMNYWGLYPHQIMEVTGRRLPIESSRYSNDIVVPENTAYWAKCTFKTARWLDRLGFIQKGSRRRHSESYSLSMRGKEWIGITQLFAFLFGIAFFVPTVQEDSALSLFLALVFLVSVSGAIVAAGAATLRTYKFLSERFSAFSKTEAWPL